MPVKNTQEKILFKISGSFKLGFGHIKRSLTLIDELTKVLSADDIVIFCSCPDKSVIEFLKPYKFFLNENAPHKIIDYIGKQNVGVVVIDEPVDNIKLCGILKKQNPEIFIFYLDYFNYKNNFINAIINLFNYKKRIACPAEEFRGRYYEGLKYAIIRSSFIPYIKKRKKIRPKPERILVTFGGADTNNNTLKSLKLLDAVGYNRNVDLVIGPFFKNKKQIIRCITSNRYSVSLYKNTNDMAKLIYRADLGFIGSGTTMMEFCALGTPAIIMPQNKRESNFASLFQREAAVKILNYVKGDRDLVSEVINNNRLRKTMSHAGKGLIDGRGKERIKDIILKAFRL